MQRHLLTALLLCAGGLTASCTRYVPITIEMMEKSNLTANDLKYVQFYVSRDVAFERKLKPSERDVGHEAGPLGLYVERILVDEKTPGVAEDIVETPLPNDKRRVLLWISFEAGSRFPFVAEGSGGFNLASTDRRLVLGDRTYDVSFEGPDRPLLLVEEDQGVELRKLKGRKVGR